MATVGQTVPQIPQLLRSVLTAAHEVGAFTGQAIVTSLAFCPHVPFESPVRAAVQP